MTVGPAPASLGFWHETGVGLGFVGITMTAMQFVLTPDAVADFQTVGHADAPARAPGKDGGHARPKLPGVPRWGGWHARCF